MTEASHQMTSNPPLDCCSLVLMYCPCTAPVLQAYAMTEASHQMTSNPLPKHGAHKPGTVGKAQGSVKVRALG
jgi:acyl-CoA synthetase (AMP-forming)/AMP-acid ligase II